MSKIMGNEVIELYDSLITTAPLYFSRKYCNKYNCDLAIPNGPGIGDVLIYTRLVTDYARFKGKKLNILTAPLNLSIGKVPDELDFPVWFNNPYINEIINSENYSDKIITNINTESENYCPFGHIMVNLLSNYGIKPKSLKPEIFLTNDEMSWALNLLNTIKRPIIALHTTGCSSPNVQSKWYSEYWKEIINYNQKKFSFVHIAQYNNNVKDLGIFTPNTTIRQSWAIIWACDFFMGFDSSPTHVATAFDKPSIVLWDAPLKAKIEESYHAGYSLSAMNRWSYPQNCNITTHHIYDVKIINYINTKLKEFRNLLYSK